MPVIAEGHKNRGKELENRIDEWLERYNKHPQMQAVKLNVEKAVTRGGRIKYTKKQPYDYEIKSTVNSLVLSVLCFDAKQTNKEKFYPAEIKRQRNHQIVELKKAQELGAKAGFLVWFKKCDPLMHNLRLITDFDKPASTKCGEHFDFCKYFGLQNGFWLRCNNL